MDRHGHAGGGQEDHEGAQAPAAGFGGRKWKVHANCHRALWDMQLGLCRDAHTAESLHKQVKAHTKVINKRTKGDAAIMKYERLLAYARARSGAHDTAPDLPEYAAAPVEADSGEGGANAGIQLAVLQPAGGYKFKLPPDLTAPRVEAAIAHFLMDATDTWPEAAAPTSAARGYKQRCQQAADGQPHVAGSLADIQKLRWFSKMAVYVDRALVFAAHANSQFHGSPRFDAVEVDCGDADGAQYAQLLGFFKYRHPLYGVTYSGALVRWLYRGRLPVSGRDAQKEAREADAARCDDISDDEFPYVRRGDNAACGDADDTSLDCIGLTCINRPVQCIPDQDRPDHFYINALLCVYDDVDVPQLK